LWWGNLRERDHLEDTGIDGRIVLIWICKKWNMGYGLDRAGSGQGQVAGTWGSIKCGEFLDQLRIG
jgi:hypothetical protein